jgi:NADH-quinone oxidoreductase subunit E
VGNFSVKLRKKPRSVDMAKCTGCGDCWNNCMARNKIAQPSPKAPAEPMKPEIAAKIDAIIEKYEKAAGQVIGILQEVQGEFNYLPRDAIAYVSEKTLVPLARLYAVARFYNAFHLTPRGKHIIRVCLGTACHLRGGGRIADAIAKELNIGNGETTKDLKFTLEHVNCLGTCALAPVITVNDKYYGKMTVAKMMKVLEKCAQKEPLEVVV